MSRRSVWVRIIYFKNCVLIQSPIFVTFVCLKKGLIFYSKRYIIGISIALLFVAIVNN